MSRMPPSKYEDKGPFESLVHHVVGNAVQYVALIPTETPGKVIRAIAMARNGLRDGVDIVHDRRFFNTLALRRARKMAEDSKYRTKVNVRLTHFDSMSDEFQNFNLKVGLMSVKSLPDKEKALIEKRHEALWGSLRKKIEREHNARVTRIANAEHEVALLEQEIRQIRANAQKNPVKVEKRSIPSLASRRHTSKHLCGND